MRTYLLLDRPAAAFRADREVREALGGAVFDLAGPTLGPGGSEEDLLADRSAFEGFDADAAGARDHGFDPLGRLALEHLLLGAR